MSTGLACRGVRLAPYTPTETNVIRLYALGLTWAEIGSELGFGRNTLSKHWQHIMEKTPGAACHIDVLRAIGWLRVA